MFQPYCPVVHKLICLPLEKVPINNRFEIQLKDEREYYAVRELLTHYDAEQTAFSIINHHIGFVDRELEKRKTDWKLNDCWEWVWVSFLCALYRYEK